MPRLPSVETLGRRPVPSPVPAVSRVDAGAATGAFAAPYAALAEQGREIMGIGDAVYQISEHLTRARRASELSEAMAGATEALGRTEIEFQKDQDFLTSPQRFVQRAGEIGKGIEDGLSDDIVKQSFRTEYRKLAAAKHLNVLQGAAKQEGDARVSQLDSALDLYATVATGTQNPAERNAVLNQARIALEEARSGGWISDVEAGKRARAFGQRLDQAMVLRDMTADPGTTAARLALDPSYGSQIDPVGRERLIDQGLNRAESQRQRQESELRRQEKEAGDKALADAWTLFADGRLTRSAVDAIKYKVSPSEYHQLLAALKKGGGDKEDNRATFGRIQWLLSTEAYDEALNEAFAAHSVGRIKDATLSSIVAQAQSRERRTGPKSPYETNRSFLASQLKPGPMSMDPAPEARMGQALMEYDDWIRSREKSPPTDTELRSKTLEIAKKWSMIDMDAMVRNTGAGTRGSPSKTLEDVELRAKQLEKQFKDKSITQAEYNRRMADLKALKDSAERAERTQGER